MDSSGDREKKPQYSTWGFSKPQPHLLKVKIDLRTEDPPQTSPPPHLPKPGFTLTDFIAREQANSHKRHVRQPTDFPPPKLTHCPTCSQRLPQEQEARTEDTLSDERPPAHRPTPETPWRSIFTETFQQEQRAWVKRRVSSGTSEPTGSLFQNLQIVEDRPFIPFVNREGVTGFKGWGNGSLDKRF